LIYLLIRYCLLAFLRFKISDTFVIAYLDNSIGKDFKNIMVSFSCFCYNQSVNNAKEIGKIFLTEIKRKQLTYKDSFCVGRIFFVVKNELFTERIKNMKQKRLNLLVLATVFALLCASICGCGASMDEAKTTTLRVGSMKGPTSMGLLFLMEKATQNTYEFQMATAADELLPLMVKGELDIALVPANVASILYQKTEGGISVINVNTLGVLYMVSGDTTVTGMEDLKGRTVYLTGKGTTPDYVLRYLMAKNGLTESDCVLEYKSEATEVAALLAEDPNAIGLLPQPFVTAACAQNQALGVVLDMNEEWNRVNTETGSGMVTGVTVVRNDFLKEYPEAVAQFLTDHEQSATAINEDVETGALYAVEKGIIAKEPIAQKAIPKCNITCMTGDEMKKALKGYLEALYEQSPEAVGGSLPAEDFYYVP